jgi:hypothetical protein
MTPSQVQAVFDNNQYFAFFESTTNPGTYGFAIYNANGTIDWVLHNTGSFRALSPEVVFYNGNNFWGTVVSITEGFSYGDSNSWTDIINNPTQQQIDNYEPGATEPLAAGETATVTAEPAPTEIFYSSITPQQQQLRDARLSSNGAHILDVDIIGNNNTVEIDQRGAGHYLELMILGNSNQVELTQEGTVSQHYQETVIEGDLNQVGITQSGSGSKTAFIVVDSANSIVTIEQTGTGSHFLDFVLEGNMHTVEIIQDGAGNHAATVYLLEGDGAWDFTLHQTGSTSQTYSLPHMLTDDTVITGICGAVQGCTLEVYQN